MTIIQQKGGNYWIEAFDVARTVITGGSSLVTAHILERGGIFLGISICLDNSESVSNRRTIEGTVRNTDNTQLIRGEFMTEFESFITNDAGGSITTGAHLVVWMKKRGQPA